ncbi:group III truncated hemoglobin [Myroides marinus]|uniref:group III truncated hemoglobin n=1 Tax=Myroides marinus TaxID=703342 RepID=UPI002578B3CE|nr:group III truncated hemoglobin [Myroides marinus]MDM1347945.1 group III truncated hemoglobin [Myroides marinus]MDM1351517.1 group III truncated hemoglobin [Myroides marinus]MDM1354924.1 group III truncated hemoglobin [Myroides marinus]MDM1358744.1 group III truncated hemoglobin [Myroides marinus]MDM1364531.1 group III truncated hemoglobin [Myroides marinus]
MRKDIENIEDIKVLVDTFYGRVQENGFIGPIFNSKLEGRWPEHIKKMYAFWETILLEEYTYRGKPFPPHAQLPVEAEHFEAWKELFNATVDELYEGKRADEAKWRAERMAAMFLSKIQYFREANMKPLE